MRRLIRQDFDKAFRQVDLIAGPVTPGPAFKLGEMADDPLAMYLADIFTIPINCAGIPALSVPCGVTSEKLPVGMQIIGPQFSEDEILKVGYAYEKR